MKKSTLIAVFALGMTSLFAEEAKIPAMTDGFEHVFKNDAGTLLNDDWRVNNSRFLPKDGTYTLVTDAKNGKYALQLTASSEGKGFGIYGGGLPVIVTPGAKVEIIFFAKGNGTFNVGFNGYDTQNAWVKDSAAVSEIKLDSEKEWKEQKVSLEVPSLPAIGYIFLVFELKPNSSVVFDDVSVNVGKKEEGK